ncbi:MAG: ribonuclease J [Clostridiales bacterium]|nr:ribonuclease J [Clostridiales bacterium]
MAAKRSKLRIIPLGGLQEIGKNMTVFEYSNEIIIVDCGVAFPQDEMLGIDLVIPDFTYLKKNADKVKALILTHGHEDHIGSIPYFLKELNIPIYGTKLTLGLLGNKLREHNLLNTTELNVVEAGETIKFKYFTVEFIQVTHSIADAVALAIWSPAGLVVHSGDFKVDYTPIHGDAINLARFAELGKEGVSLFLCESTNVESPGYSMSEKSVGEIFQKVFDDSANQRIMVATFASNIHRIQQIITAAIKHHRKVAVIGRSMENAVKTATELGYIQIPPNSLIDVSEIKNYSDKQLVIISTGSQGEPMSALSRMAAGEHRQVEIKPGDKIIISASVIPGNEKMVNKIVNDLLRLGAEVINESAMTDIHVSGHGKKEEIKLLHALIKPDFLMPIHGEYKHLIAHKDLAVSMGMNKKNVFVMNIGEVLELGDKQCKVNGSVPSGQIFVDGLGVGDVGSIVIRDRKHLSQDGLIIVVVTMEKETSSILAGPDIVSRGFVYVRESENLLEEARCAILGALEKCEPRRISDWSYTKNLIRDTLKDYVWQKTKRRPMILPVIMEV